jgi:hypothetical protein
LEASNHPGFMAQPRTKTPARLEVPAQGRDTLVDLAQVRKSDRRRHSPKRPECLLASAHQADVSVCEMTPLVCELVFADLKEKGEEVRTVIAAEILLRPSNKRRGASSSEPETHGRINTLEGRVSSSALGRRKTYGGELTRDPGDGRAGASPSCTRHPTCSPQVN